MSDDLPAPKRGRPPMPPENLLSEVLPTPPDAQGPKTFKVRPAMADEIYRLATKKRQSVGATIRELLAEALAGHSRIKTHCAA